MAKKAARKTPSKAARPTTGVPAAVSPSFGQVKQLVKLMVDNDLSELHVEEGPRKILLKRGGPIQPPVQVLAQAGGVQPAAAAAAKPEPPPAEQAEELLEIKSPMVGTFYSAAGPDSEPYASTGDVVAPEDVVCIVEAMKVMNEIKAECSGTIVETCVQNAQPVEFGQTLFRVRPA